MCVDVLTFCPLRGSLLGPAMHATLPCHRLYLPVCALTAESAQVRCLDLRDRLRSPGCNELAADALEVLATAGRHVALASPSSDPNPNPDPGSSPDPGATVATEQQPAQPGVGGGASSSAEPMLKSSGALGRAPPLLRALSALLEPGRAPLRVAAAAARALAVLAQAPHAIAAVGPCVGELCSGAEPGDFMAMWQCMLFSAASYQ